MLKMKHQMRRRRKIKKRRRRKMPALMRRRRKRRKRSQALSRRRRKVRRRWVFQMRYCIRSNYRPCPHNRPPPSIDILLYFHKLSPTWRSFGTSGREQIYGRLLSRIRYSGNLFWFLRSSFGRADCVMDSHTTGPRFKTWAHRHKTWEYAQGFWHRIF